MGSTPRCDPIDQLVKYLIMKEDLKKKATEVINSFEEVKSVVCIVSNGNQSAALVGSEGEGVLKNTLISMMIQQPELKSLFQGAIVAAMLNGEEK